MNEIRYLIGDATKPDKEGNKIIVHVCNDVGKWGKGFVMALSKRWKDPKIKYLEWFKEGTGFELGKVQFVKVENNLWVANLIGQQKIKRSSDDKPPIRYWAIGKGIIEVKNKALELDASIHMPRIGCGLAGGKWDKIRPILDHELITFGIETFVYDFE